MDKNFYRAMYGGSSRIDRTTPQMPVQTSQTSQDEKDYGKAPSRVIGGLKAQNAHVTNVDIDGKIVDIPRLEYIKALEEEIKLLKIRDSINTKKLIRLEAQNRSMETRLSVMDSAIKSIEANKNSGQQYAQRFQTSFKPKTRS